MRSRGSAIRRAKEVKKLKSLDSLLTNYEADQAAMHFCACCDVVAADLHPESNR